jgi:hypothetical protein
MEGYKKIKRFNPNFHFIKFDWKRKMSGMLYLNIHLQHSLNLHKMFFA